MTFDPLTRFLNLRSTRSERRALLRPMTTSEIQDAALGVYRALGGRILALSALPALFATIAAYFIVSFLLPRLTQTSNPDSVSAQIVEMGIILGLTVLVALPMLLFTGSLSSAMACNLVADHVAGNVPNPAAARAAAVKYLGRIFQFGIRETLLGAGGLIVGVILIAVGALLDQTSVAMSGAAAGVGILAIIVSLVAMPIIFSYESLSIPAMMIEGLSVSAAAKRSRELLKASNRHPSGSGAVFNMYALMFFLVLMLAIGIGATLGTVTQLEIFRKWLESPRGAEIIDQFIGVVPTYLAIWLLVPVWAVTTTIIYYERRVRLEGYDIEALTQDIWRSDRSHRFQF